MIRECLLGTSKMNNKEKYQLVKAAGDYATMFPEKALRQRQSTPTLAGIFAGKDLSESGKEIDWEAASPPNPTVGDTFKSMDLAAQNNMVPPPAEILKEAPKAAPGTPAPKASPVAKEPGSLAEFFKNPPIK